MILVMSNVYRAEFRNDDVWFYSEACFANVFSCDSLTPVSYPIGRGFGGLSMARREPRRGSAILLGARGGTKWGWGTALGNPAGFAGLAGWGSAAHPRKSYPTTSPEVLAASVEIPHPFLRARAPRDMFPHTPWMALT
jgi:hypothetical protein